MGGEFSPFHLLLHYENGEVNDREWDFYWARTSNFCALLYVILSLFTTSVDDQICRQTGVASSNRLVCGIEFFPSRIVLAHCIDELNQQLLILP